jgi:hypothetical protein
MKRSRAMLVVAIVAALVVVPSLASAKPSPGLGVFSGFKLHPGGEIDLSYNFGFLVDLPLIQTFHICPSADTYKIGDAAVTDLSLAFKFIIPLRGLRPYAAIAPGLTTFGNERDMHLAGSLGTYIQLVANIDLLVGVQYKRMMINDDEDLTKSGQFLGQAGVLFRF